MTNKTKQIIFSAILTVALSANQFSHANGGKNYGKSGKYNENTSYELSLQNGNKLEIKVFRNVKEAMSELNKVKANLHVDCSHYHSIPDLINSPRLDELKSVCCIFLAKHLIAETKDECFKNLLQELKNLQYIFYIEPKLTGIKINRTSHNVALQPENKKRRINSTERKTGFKRKRNDQYDDAPRTPRKKQRLNSQSPSTPKHKRPRKVNLNPRIPTREVLIWQYPIPDSPRRNGL